MVIIRSCDLLHDLDHLSVRAPPVRRRLVKWQLLCLMMCHLLTVIVKCHHNHLLNLSSPNLWVELSSSLCHQHNLYIFMTNCKYIDETKAKPTRRGKTLDLTFDNLFTYSAHVRTYNIWGRSHSLLFIRKSLILTSMPIPSFASLCYE